MSAPRKALPSNWETERALLGGLMLDPEQLSEVRPLVASPDFHRPHHAELYRMLCRLADEGAPPVRDHGGRRPAAPRRLRERRRGRVSVRASTGVSEHRKPRSLRWPHPDSRAGPSVSAVVSGRYRARRGRRRCHNRARQPHRCTRAAARGRRLAEEIHHRRDAIDEAVAEIRRRAENPGKLLGLSTGFTNLDRKLSGLQPGKLYLLAARPAIGKSCIAQNIAENVAKTGTPSESSRSRWPSASSPSGPSSPRPGWTTAGSPAARSRRWKSGQRITNAAEEEYFRDRPVYVDDASSQTLTQIRSKVRRMVAQHGVRLVVLDYLQLVNAQGRNREQEIAAISKALRALTELDIPILALAQLSRACSSVVTNARCAAISANRGRWSRTPT